MRVKKNCSVKGCGRAAIAYGICATHYARKRKYLDVFADVPVSKSRGRTPLSEIRHRQMLPKGLFRCTSCHQLKSVAVQLYESAQYRYQCKDCQRDRQISHKYGVTSTDYARMLKRQKGRCGLCGTTKPGSNRKHFCIDHNHVSGVVRGLLCCSCNAFLVGIFERQGISIRQLRDYLAGKFRFKKRTEKKA